MLTKEPFPPSTTEDCAIGGEAACYLDEKPCRWGVEGRGHWDKESKQWHWDGESSPCTRLASDPHPDSLWSIQGSRPVPRNPILSAGTQEAEF